MMPPRLLIEPILRAALLEDIGHGGDLTTDAIVAQRQRARFRIVARQGGIVAGLQAALLAFELLDDTLEIRVSAHDGDRVRPGQSVAELAGSARAMLTGERTALNVLSHCSGIATATAQLVDAVEGTQARVTDTRKTTPGLRVLEKYAVRCGGGVNHRFALDDAILIKDNHLALAQSIHSAVAAVRARVGHMAKVSIEVDTFDQLQAALAEPIDAVLLDNMPLEQLADAVRIVGGRVVTEASGGVTHETIAAIARTGVDFISVGSLTHSIRALDFGMDAASH